jgi:hypothetical protein
MKTTHYLKMALVLFFGIVGTVLSFAQKYEAEDATYGGGAEFRDSDPGFSGTGFVRNFNEVGQYVEFAITGAAAGTQNVTLHYATGQAGSLNLYVNGMLIRSEAIPGSGGWSTWVDYPVSVTLNAGNNTIKFKHDADNTGNFFYYIDYLKVEGAGSVSGVTVSPSILSISDKSSSQLTATVLPSDAPDKSVTWSSSDEYVARVSETGLVTGVAVGNATITATTVDGGKTATCLVTVTSSTEYSHGSIIKRNALLDEVIDWTHGTTFPDNSTVDYKIVTIGGKLWATIVGLGYNLHFQPWSSQIRLYPLPGNDDNMWELTKYNAPNNVNYNTSNNTTIVTACPYPNPAFDHIRIVQSQMDAYSGTALTAYNVNAPNSGLTTDNEKPLLTKAQIGSQDGTTIPVSCTATDNSGDYFYIVADVVNNFYFVSFTDEFAVTGLTEGITYSFNVVAVDFSGNQSVGITTSQSSINADGATGTIWLSRNPFSTGTLTIQLPEDAATLSIVDITGKAIYQTPVARNEYSIDRSMFKSEGIYIVNVMTANGIKNQKLVVTK